MSRATDLTAAVSAARHCADICCRKCRARARWNRRRAWRTRTSTARRKTGRK